MNSSARRTTSASCHDPACGISSIRNVCSPWSCQRYSPVGIHLAATILRIDRPARDGNAQVVSLHAVAILGIVDDGQTIRASAALTGKINPPLPGILFPHGLANQEPVRYFVSRPRVLHIHREGELQDLHVLVPIQEHARFQAPGAGQRESSRFGARMTRNGSARGPQPAKDRFPARGSWRC